MKKAISILIMTILIISGIQLFFPIASADATNTWVDDDASPGWYDATHVKTITEGIANASAGGTSTVYPGTYTASLTIQKQLRLVAYNATKPQINGKITISGSISVPVHIEGFSINGASNNAIAISRANYVNVTKCNLTATGATVVSIQGRYGNISYCNITGGTFVPVRLSTISSWTEGNNVLWYNNISGASIVPESGVSIVQLSTEVGGNTVVGNRIHDSTNETYSYGIYVDDSGNWIYHNNFINNARHAWASASANYWNLSYPGGGNYWEGHGTQDIYFGANQDLVGYDLICDLNSPDQYNISENNVDHYPFLNQFDGTLPSDINRAPAFGTPNPANGSTNQSLSFAWQIGITDANSDTFNWTIECNNSQSSGANGEIDGTKSLSLSDLTNDTTYTIWVNATDGIDWTREWYTFNTTLNYPPSQPTNEHPANNSDYVLINAKMNVKVIDQNNDSMNVTFYWGNNSLINSIHGVASNTVAEFTIIDFMMMSHNTEYTWYVTVDDGEANITGPTWTFHTCRSYDLNGDDTVNYLDISSLVSHYGESVSPSGSQPWDINNDGATNYLDISGLVSHYGESY